MLRSFLNGPFEPSWERRVSSLYPFCFIFAVRFTWCDAGRTGQVAKKFRRAHFAIDGRRQSRLKQRALPQLAG